MCNPSRKQNHFFQNVVSEKIFAISPEGARGEKRRRIIRDMKKMQIKKLDVLSERQPGLRPANTLFNVYVQKVDELNRAHVKKEKLANELNVTSRTVANWIRALVNVGAIKYKYSGEMRLNPDVYFDGATKNYKKALEEFKKFKSDI